MAVRSAPPVASAPPAASPLGAPPTSSPTPASTPGPAATSPAGPLGRPAPLPSPRRRGPPLSRRRRTLEGPAVERRRQPDCSRRWGPCKRRPASLLQGGAGLYQGYGSSVRGRRRGFWLGDGGGPAFSTATPPSAEASSQDGARGPTRQVFQLFLAHPSRG